MQKKKIKAMISTWHSIVPSHHNMSGRTKKKMFSLKQTRAINLFQFEQIQRGWRWRRRKGKKYDPRISSWVQSNHIHVTSI